MQDVGLGELSGGFPNIRALHAGMLESGTVPVPLTCAYGTGTLPPPPRCACRVCACFAIPLAALPPQPLPPRRSRRRGGRAQRSVCRVIAVWIDLYRRRVHPIRAAQSSSAQ